MADWKTPNGSAIGLGINGMTTEEEKAFLEIACENDNFYYNAVVVAYVEMKTGNVVVQIVHNENLVQFRAGLAQVAFVGQISTLSVPTYCYRVFGCVPQRTIRDSKKPEQ